MSQNIPTVNFKWVKEIGAVTKIKDSNKTGYNLEVDLKYPKKFLMIISSTISTRECND